MAETSESETARFRPIGLEDWQASVEAGLKGGSIEERLASRSSDGTRFWPLYTDRVETPSHLPPRSEGGWQRHEDLDAGELAGAIVRMKRAVSFGIDSFRVRGCPRDEQQALIEAARELGTSLYFVKATTPALALERLRLGFAGGQHLGQDPLDADVLAAWRESTTPTRLQRASSSIEQEQGAGPQLQIALCLWRGVRWLRRAMKSGLSLQDATQALEFELALGTDIFLEVAKLRALRLAWSRLLAACGDEELANDMHLHARCSERAWTKYDPWVNGLRGTTIAFAAAVGGADSVLLLPFDALVGAPEEDALRLASNTHAILADEASLAAVEDPAAGSGYIESLTEQLASGAWRAFGKLESSSENEQSLASEWIEQEIARAAELEARSVATRRKGLIGVTEFPNLDEERPSGHSRGVPSSGQRLAAPFEELRQRSDKALAANGMRPQAFLANLGQPAEFRARSGFAKNLLAAGGIAALDNDGFANIDEALGAFRSSGAHVAVIASTDKMYNEHAAPLARGLCEAGATVALAGTPGAREEEWTAAGVQHYIHVGCDALQVLVQLQRSAEVSP